MAGSYYDWSQYADQAQGKSAFSGSAEDQYKNVLAGYQKQFDDAKNMYLNANSVYGQLYKQQAGYGESSRLNMETEAARNLAKAQGSMASRGLYNTSAYDAATRGSNADKQAGYLQLQDQLYNRQNNIRLSQLGFQAGSNQMLAGIAGQQNAYMGGVQQATQAQDLQKQLALADQQYRRQLTQEDFIRQQMDKGLYGYHAQAMNDKAPSGRTIAPAQDTAPYQPRGGGGPSSSQVDAGGGASYGDAAWVDWGSFDIWGDQGGGGDSTGGGGGDGGEGFGGGDSGFEGYAHGGKVPGRGNRDTVPAKLTPGEFVLSKQMIADIRTGKMTLAELKKKFGQKPKGKPGHYGMGGPVKQANDMFAPNNAVIHVDEMGQGHYDLGEGREAVIPGIAVKAMYGKFGPEYVQWGMRMAPIDKIPAGSGPYGPAYDPLANGGMGGYTGGGAGEGQWDTSPGDQGMGEEQIAAVSSGAGMGSAGGGE